jgi:uncharacterized protein (DUF1778 family)
MEKKDTTRMSFRFEEEYKKLLEEIAKIERRSMTDELRLLIDKRAVELGLTPVYPVEGKVNE